MKDVEASFKFEVGQKIRLLDVGPMGLVDAYSDGDCVEATSIEDGGETACIDGKSYGLHADWLEEGLIEMVEETQEPTEFQFEVGQAFRLHDAESAVLYPTHENGDILIVEFFDGDGAPHVEGGGWLTQHDIEQGYVELVGSRVEDVQKGPTSSELEVKPIASDGGSSSYYDIQLPEWLVENICSREAGGQAFIKTEELVEVAFNNDFDFGNIFKSTVRAHGAFNGAGKAGNGVDYEANKIKYSADKVKARYERKGNE